MTLCKLLSRAAILAIAVVLLTVPVSARADTYQILALTSDNAHTLIGIDTAGDVVVFATGSECQIALGGGILNCYQTFVDGVVSSVSATIPSLAYDDGTPCVPNLPSGVFSFIHGVCNNGREAFESGPSGSTNAGLYTGPDPVADFLHGPLADTIFLNASGDIAFSDSFREEIYEAVDLTTDVVPEPSTLVLLATGVLGATGALRRRFVRMAL